MTSSPFSMMLNQQRIQGIAETDPEFHAAATDIQMAVATSLIPGGAAVKAVQVASKVTTATKATSTASKIGKAGDKGLATRGVKPSAGSRTAQGQVDDAVSKTRGNPTVTRGGQDLVRLRGSGHGKSGSTATPQNVTRTNPAGQKFTGKGPDRAVSNKDMKELHKA